jgi:hypothetical protein
MSRAVEVPRRVHDQAGLRLLAIGARLKEVAIANRRTRAKAVEDNLFLIRNCAARGWDRSDQRNSSERENASEKPISFRLTGPHSPSLGRFLAPQDSSFPARLSTHVVTRFSARDQVALPVGKAGFGRTDVHAKYKCQ